MANLRNLVLLFFGVYFVQTHAADKYTDENRPYEFGFTIEGEQHRHEKKDENGIIMGEFGFITADGVYHVTVYATDENGNFKILSMKNIRVKPYPTSPEAGVKKSNFVNSPQKDSIPESTKEVKAIKKQIASPAKSCSHCLLPTTTTTTTTASPAKSEVSAKFTNSQPPANNNHNENEKYFSDKNPISSPNIADQQKAYNYKSHQSSSPTVAQNYPQGEQTNKNIQNSQSPIQNFGYQQPHFEPIPQSYHQAINNQNYPQQNIVSNQAINPDGQQYFNAQNKRLNLEQQTLVPRVRQNTPGVSQLGNISPQSDQDYHPISKSLQAPVNEDNFLPNEALAQNEQNDNRFNNYTQKDFDNNNNYPEAQDYIQQHNYEEVNKPNKLPNSLPQAIISPPTMQPHNKDEQQTVGNLNGDRSPKSFGDFIQQSVGPEELANTGPNIYRPSLPNSSQLSGKPVLLAAQMQIVAKDTNIYNKNPGETEGLPEGITVDDMTNLLYTFNYTVGFHGHHEKGYSNGAKQGYYYVTGRNGIRTRVDYVADEKGFRPKITQEILDIASEEVPKPETEKDEKYGLKGYEFKWLYFPLDSKTA